jgi:hypothetical protein
LKKKCTTKTRGQASQGESQTEGQLIGVIRVWGLAFVTQLGNTL